MLLHILPSNTPHCPPYQPFSQCKEGEKYLNWTIWFHSNLCRKATDILSHYTTSNAYLVLQILSHRKTSVITHVWNLEFVGHKHLPHFHRWCMFGVQNFRLWIYCCTTTNSAYLHLVIGPQKCHQTSTDNACLVLGILDHAQKLHISNNNVCLVFKNVGHTYIPQGLIRLISTNTCYFSSALLPWNTNPLGSKGVTILIYIGSQTMQDSGALILAYTLG